MKLREVHIPTISLVLLALAGPPLALSADGEQAPASSGPPAQTAETAEDAARRMYHRLPLYFEANAGQTEPEVEFLTRSVGGTVFLTPREAVIAMAPRDDLRGGMRSSPEPGDSQPRAAESAVVRMRLVGANPEPRLKGEEALDGRLSYFLGSDPKGWKRSIRTYAKVRYEEVYPGVDLVYYGNQQHLEYDFVVAPGADPERIRLAFTGAERAELDADGNLVLDTAAGQLRQSRPYVYQEIDGKRRQVDGQYVLLAGNDGHPRTPPVQVAFRLGSYDPRHPLVIDPVLIYSTLLGGSEREYVGGLAVDGDGNAYVTGMTQSLDFPGPGPRSPRPAESMYQVFVTRFNPQGNGIVYTAVLGGTNHGIYDDRGYAIGVDPDGNAWVAGHTSSEDFPTTGNALLPEHPNFDPFRPNTGFLSKLSPDGSQLLYSTYFGGKLGETVVLDVAVELGGRAFITGVTEARDDPNTSGVNEGIPTLSAFQPANAGLQDAFVARFEPDGTLTYSSYLGGEFLDEGLGIAVGLDGTAHVTGRTESYDRPDTPRMELPFPTTPGAIQPEYAGSLDAFVTSVAASGGAISYSTYLGGSGVENFNTFHTPQAGIAVDPSGNLYVTGSTSSADFPVTAGAFQSAYQGGVRDAFVAKILPDAGLPVAQQLIYSTFLGGSGTERGHAISVDAAGNAYVTGSSDSSNFPLVNEFPIAFSHAPFVSQLNPSGSALLYSTRVGGQGTDMVPRGIGLGGFGDIYVAGDGAPSTSWQVTEGAFQTVSAGAVDAWVMRIRISENALRITGCEMRPTSLRSRGGRVTLKVQMAGEEPVESVAAILNRPDNTTATVPLRLRRGIYTGRIRIRANRTDQEQLYQLKVLATGRNGTQVEQDCGQITVAGRKPKK